MADEILITTPVAKDVTIVKWVFASIVFDDENNSVVQRFNGLDASGNIVQRKTITLTTPEIATYLSNAAAGISAGWSFVRVVRRAAVETAKDRIADTPATIG